ncbi:MAG: precorrin-2 C(20)-methyltransferase [Thermoleophilia bacterium]
MTDNRSNGKNTSGGRLIGVGVGPGDVGMLTLKAVALIESAAVLAYPVNRVGADSRAFTAAQEHVSSTARRLPLLMPMTRDKAELERSHAAAVRALAEAAAGGDDIVYLSLGDPLFYSTFGYLADRFPGEVEVVSGVSSMSAMAAALGRAIAEGDTPTMVVTGKDRAGIAAALELDASLVIIKPRALTEESLDLLESAGAFRRASAALELGGEQQKIIDVVDREAAAALPYFSILWIRPSKDE